MKELTVGINQPYYLPYTGFFDRAKSCDLFVINSYCPLNRRGTHHKRVKVVQLHPDCKDNTIYLTERIGSKLNNNMFVNVTLDQVFWSYQKCHIDTLYNTYHKAPFFEYTKKILELMEDDSCKNLGEYNTKLIFFLADKLGMVQKFVDLTKEKDFQKDVFLNDVPDGYLNKATYGNLQVCKYFKATKHITGQNGPLWLDEQVFNENKIQVYYQKVNFEEYRQFSKCRSFLKGLSVLDLLFNCGEKSKGIIGKGSKFVDRETLLKTTKLTGR